MRVLGIAGSLRAGSLNSALLAAAADVAPEGVEVEPFVGLRDLPHYDADLDREPVPEPVRRLRDAIEAADAVLVVTPEYNGTIPGVLKNAIDWASRPFPENALRGKPVAVSGATTGGFGGVWAQADARKALGIAGARTIERGVAIPSANDHLDPEEGLRTASFREELTRVLEDLRAEVPAVAR